jgi:hypothetical protein
MKCKEYKEKWQRWLWWWYSILWWCYYCLLPDVITPSDPSYRQARSRETVGTKTTAQAQDRWDSFVRFSRADRCRLGWCELSSRVTVEHNGWKDLKSRRDNWLNRQSLFFVDNDADVDYGAWSYQTHTFCTEYRSNKYSVRTHCRHQRTIFSCTIEGTGGAQRTH